jgi:hypothetical protein
MSNTSATVQPTQPKRKPSSSKANDLEAYHLIIHCRDEAQQRELFERLRCEGLRCRLTVL